MDSISGSISIGVIEYTAVEEDEKPSHNRHLEDVDF